MLLLCIRKDCHTFAFWKSIFVRTVRWWRGCNGRALFPSGALGVCSEPCINRLNAYNCEHFPILNSIYGFTTKLNVVELLSRYTHYQGSNGRLNRVLSNHLVYGFHYTTICPFSTSKVQRISFSLIKKIAPHHNVFISMQCISPHS